jgi:hypothetical protein
MKPEEAEKVAEAITLAVREANSEDMERTLVDLQSDIVKILTTEPAAPAEKEYRAGEWVPKFGMKYWHYDAGAAVDWELWYGETIDNVWLSGGNVFPTEAIAEAAKKHAEWWRAFDVADEGGEVSVWAWTTGGLHVSANDSKDSNPRWKTAESARAWVESHGGEAYVSEMLTKGRVFRFKWGGV